MASAGQTDADSSGDERAAENCQKATSGGDGNYKTSDGAAASVPQRTETSPESLWDHPEIRKYYPQLVSGLDPAPVRRSCFGERLLTDTQRDTLSKIPDKAGHNEGLLGCLYLIGNQPDLFQKFIDIMRRSSSTMDNIAEAYQEVLNQHPDSASCAGSTLQRRARQRNQTAPPVAAAGAAKTGTVSPPTPPHTAAASTSVPSSGHTNAPVRPQQLSNAGHPTVQEARRPGRRHFPVSDLALPTNSFTETMTLALPTAQSDGYSGGSSSSVPQSPLPTPTAQAPTPVSAAGAYSWREHSTTLQTPSPTSSGSGVFRTPPSSPLLDLPTNNPKLMEKLRSVQVNSFPPRTAIVRSFNKQVTGCLDYFVRDAVIVKAVGKSYCDGILNQMVGPDRKTSAIVDKWIDTSVYKISVKTLLEILARSGDVQYVAAFWESIRRDKDVDRAVKELAK